MVKLLRLAAVHKSEIVAAILGVSSVPLTWIVLRHLI